MKRYSNVFTTAINQQTLRSLSINQFAEQRSAYNDKVSVLRKEWKAEHEAKLERIRLEELEKQRKDTIRQAIKLRETRRITAQNIASYEKARQLAADMKREKLATSHVLHREKVARQQRRYSAAIADLEEEKTHWLTLDNLDQKINNSLFETPATTGITTRNSEFWRYSAYSVDLKRMEYDGTLQGGRGSALDRRLNAEADKNFEHKIETVDFLNQIVSTGDERARFRELVDEFSEYFTSEDELQRDIEEANGVAQQKRNYHFSDEDAQQVKQGYVDEDLVEYDPVSDDHINTLSAGTDEGESDGSEEESGMQIVDDEIDRIMPVLSAEEDKGDYKKVVMESKQSRNVAPRKKK